MFFIVSKFFAFILKPIGILLMLTLYSVYIENRTKARRIQVLILAILLIHTMPVFSDFFVAKLEQEPIPMAKIQPCEIGIVLTGGIINESMSTNGTIILGSQGDRIWQALQLYKANKIKSIIISGGDFLTNNSELENDKCRAYLISNGVPGNAIMQEKKSLNTYQNALFTAKILTHLKKNNQQVVLISSAFHLKRAKACFDKQGIKTIVWPSASIKNNKKTKLIDFVPTIDALYKIDKVANEIIGLLFYKIAGYI